MKLIENFGVYLTTQKKKRKSQVHLLNFQNGLETFQLD